MNIISLGEKDGLHVSQAEKTIQSSVSPYNFLAFWLHRLSGAVMKRFEAALAEHDVTVAQWNLLLFIAHEGASTPREISVMAGIDASAVTRGLDRLEKKTYIRRVYDQDDGRSVRIMMTPLGTEVIVQTTDVAISQDLYWTSEGDASRQEVIVMLKTLLAQDVLAQDFKRSTIVSPPFLISSCITIK